MIGGREMAWIRRAAAVSAVALLAVRLVPAGRWGACALGVCVALVWSLDSLLTSRARARANSTAMIVEVLLLGWTAVGGLFAWWLVPTASLSVLCWNSGEFLARWRDPPPADCSRYLARIGATLGIGTAAGLSAALLRGHFSIGFTAGLLLLIAGGASLLRLLATPGERRQ